jgi:phytoene dehydrogenase-like protein
VAATSHHVGHRPKAYDALVIGAGHNGLVCAATLARGGRSVLVLEAANQVGGAALTREFAPGFRVSAGAHLLHLMPADLLRELQLESHGLEWAARGMNTTALVHGNAPLAVGESPAAAESRAVGYSRTASQSQAVGHSRADTESAGLGLSAADAQAYSAYAARMRRFAAALAPIFSRTPPRLGTTAWADRLALLRMGWQIRKLGRKDMRELLRIGGMNVYDLLEENFDSVALKGALGFDAVLGANFGPRSPGTVLTLLYRLAAESAAGASGLSQPKGGMGALCDALAKAAMAAGATIRTGSPVAGIVVENDRARGVVLESGERIESLAVISSADPKNTFLRLLGPRHLDTGFVRRVNHIRSRGLAAKLHLALNRAPPFDGVNEAALSGRLLIAPSLQHIEHAYNHAKYGEFSADPVMEVTVPTINDPTLAPSGHHVLSAIVQYAPYALKEGWQSGRQRFLDTALDSLERYAPGLRGCIVGAELLTPADMETEFRMSGGHWHHGDLAFDQFLMVRPVPGAAQYRTPMNGLFLCGAGCHPGGGVMGVAGRNAAREVLTLGTKAS